jgi:hypothetical protein
VTQLDHLGRQAVDRRQRLGSPVPARPAQSQFGVHRPGQLAGQTQVQQHANGVHVGGRGGRDPVEAFRGDEGRRADHRAVQSGFDLPGRRGDAEVEHLDPGRGEHDVGRFDVPVHDAVRMRGGERRTHLGADPYADPPVDRPGGEMYGQGLPLGQLHHDVRQRLAGQQFGLAEVVHAGHVGVQQLGGRPGLGADPVQRLRLVGVPRGDQLHRDRTVQHPVAGPPDLGHPPDADALFEVVTLVQRPHQPLLPSPSAADRRAEPGRLMLALRPRRRLPSYPRLSSANPPGEAPGRPGARATGRFRLR